VAEFLLVAEEMLGEESHLFTKSGIPKFERMDKATLTISLPRTMKEFIEAKLQEGRFSTPSEYIRSLIRNDQDVTGNKELAVLIRRGGLASSREARATSPSKAMPRRQK